MTMADAWLQRERLLDKVDSKKGQWTPAMGPGCKSMLKRNYVVRCKQLVANRLGTGVFHCVHGSLMDMYRRGDQRDSNGLLKDGPQGFVLQGGKMQGSSGSCVWEITRLRSGSDERTSHPVSPAS